MLSPTDFSQRLRLSLKVKVETSRCTLVPFADRYCTERYVGWLNDPEVTHYSEQRGRHHTIESGRAYWNSMQKQGSPFWAIVAKDESLGHIGNLSAYIDSANAVVDVAILVGERKVWGQGYGSEAFCAACSFLLNSGSFRKVTAGTLAANHAMLKIMEKAGMKPDGIRKAHVMVDGQPMDVHFYAMFARLSEMFEGSGH